MNTRPKAYESSALPLSYPAVSGYLEGAGRIQDSSPFVEYFFHVPDFFSICSKRAAENGGLSFLSDIFS